MKKSNSSISGWLDKHGDPDIIKQVEEEAIDIIIENTNKTNYKEELKKVLDIVNNSPYGWLDKDSVESKNILNILESIYKKGFEEGVNSSYDDI